MRDDAALQKRVELVFDKLRQARPCLRFDLGSEALEVFPDHPIQGGFFRAPALVENGVTSRRRLNCFAHGSFLLLCRLLLLYTVPWNQALCIKLCCSRRFALNR